MKRATTNKYCGSFFFCFWYRNRGPLGINNLDQFAFFAKWWHPKNKTICGIIHHTLDKIAWLHTSRFSEWGWYRLACQTVPSPLGDGPLFWMVTQGLVGIYYTAENIFVYRSSETRSHTAFFQSPLTVLANSKEELDKEGTGLLS